MDTVLRVIAAELGSAALAREVLADAGARGELTDVAQLAHVERCRLAFALAERAITASGPTELKSGFRRVRPDRSQKAASDEPGGVVWIDVQTDYPAQGDSRPELLALLDRLRALDDDDRRTLVIDALANESENDFEPLLSIIAPSPRSLRRRAGSLHGPAVWFALAAVVLFAVVVTDWRGATDPPGDRTTSTTTADALPPDSRGSEMAAPKFVDPERTTKLVVADDVILLVEPELGLVVWASRSFDRPAVIDVSGDVITIESGGHRLYLSLQDGTLLPP